MPAAAEGQLLRPDWDLPPGVQARMTTRQGGHSAGPWQGWNMGRLCADSPAAVARNRAQLQQQLGLESPIRYLHQVHGAAIVQRQPGESKAWQEPQADGHWTASAGLGLAVLAADCLPVLLASARGTLIGAVHAGWRGLAAGVLRAQVREMRAHLPAGESLGAWIGVGIGPCHYQVDARVIAAILAATGKAAQACLHEHEAHHAYLDLAGVAAIQLRTLGVEVRAQTACTACDDRLWYSHRRDGVTGRMAAVIWREPLCASDNIRSG